MTRIKQFNKILLINLLGVEQSGYRPSPLGILYLAAYLREKIPKIKIEIIDGAIEGETAVVDKIKSMRPDLLEFQF